MTMINVSDKEDFCSYLEETAAEIRAFKMSREYLDDMCRSMQQQVNKFYNVQNDMIDNNAQAQA